MIEWLWEPWNEDNTKHFNNGGDSVEAPVSYFLYLLFSRANGCKDVWLLVLNIKEVIYVFSSSFQKEKHVL